MDVTSLLSGLMRGPALGFVVELARRAGAPIAEIGSADEIDRRPAPDVLPAAAPLAQPGLAINQTKFRLAPGQFLAQAQTKTGIVLHFTAGPTAASAVGSWVSDSRTVATAYVVDVDGAIYECFDPKFWAGHIGQSGYPNEKRTIGIEIAGWGPLKRQGEYLCAWPSNWTRRVVHVGETSKYVQKPFRGIGYFTVFPELQVQAVCELVAHLCDRFRIPREIPPAPRRGVADKAFFSGFRGVMAHENFRSDKWDIGPAWDWERLAAALRS